MIKTSRLQKKVETNKINTFSERVVNLLHTHKPNSQYITYSKSTIHELVMRAYTDGIEDTKQTYNIKD